MTTLYLDCEFNGFGGKLMSMALVPHDDVEEFYREVHMTDQLDPWVAENVVPHLWGKPVGYSEFQTLLQAYLAKFDTIEIVADWPDDIRYFCEALITGPGEMLATVKQIDFRLDRSIHYRSLVNHHALHDARGIREYYLKDSKP